MSTPVLGRIVDWYCPNCGQRDQTNDPRPHTRMHVCPKLHMLTAPMVQQGVKAQVTAHLRDDYVNGELVQTAPEDGRPYMSIVTERADGSNDVRVLAPAARASHS